MIGPLCGLLFVLAWTGSPSETPVRLFTVDARSIDGTEVRRDPSGDLVLTTGSGSRETVTEEETLAVHFPGHAPVAPDAGVEVVLVGGDVVVGRVTGGDEFELRLQSTIGPLRIDLDRIRRITFPPLRDRVSSAPPLGPRDDADLLYRVTSRGLDVVEGTLLSFENEGILFDGPGGEFLFRYPEIAAVVLLEEPGSANAGDAPGATVHTIDGSSLRGTLAALDAGKVRLRSDPLGDLEVPLDRVLSVVLAPDGYEHLSERAPASVAETPYFGSDDAFLFGYRHDRTVTGRPLVVDGIRFEKGFGVHARSRLAFPLEQRYARFYALVGVSDEVRQIPAAGRVVARVLVDGEVRFASGVLEPGRPAVRVPPVSLEGASEIVLEVDFADDTDAGDRAVWAHPVLVPRR